MAKRTLVYILGVETRRQTVTLFNGGLDWAGSVHVRQQTLAPILHISVDDGNNITGINFMIKNKF